MMNKTHALAALLLALSPVAIAQDAAFDVHVHLRDGEASIEEYEARLESANL